MPLTMIYGLPLIVYVFAVKTTHWSVGIGITLVAVTIWASLGFAADADPKGSGLEFIWPWYGFLINTCAVVFGGFASRSAARRY